MISVIGWVVNETSKAVLFCWLHRPGVFIWLPKSQCSIVRDEWWDRLTIPAWLAQRHQMRAAPTPRVREVALSVA